MTERVEKMTFDQQCEALACKADLTPLQIKKVLKAQADIAHAELKAGNTYSVYHLGVLEKTPNGRTEGTFRVSFHSSIHLKEAVNA